ncbi:MAG: hypothetical protein FJ125_01435, partial [Deltaproteobacteria bacterium]|nr:hypothetical protein [Deltaproteobacteria bacterium]
MKIRWAIRCSPPASPAPTSWWWATWQSRPRRRRRTWSSPSPPCPRWRGRSSPSTVRCGACSRWLPRRPAGPRSRCSSRSSSVWGWSRAARTAGSPSWEAAEQALLLPSPSGGCYINVEERNLRAEAGALADPIEEPTPSSTESRCSTPPPLPSSPTTGAGGEAAAFCFPVRGQKWADRFEILEQIDEDAGGLVYRARDAQAAGQVVALWILPPEVRDAVDLAALGEELQRAQALDHKNLVRVHGWGEARAGLHFWMEYVSGQRLSALIEKKRKVATSAAFSLKGSYNLVAHLLHALSAAHPRLVHGALSPDAVLIDGRGRVRLLGLGISRHLPRPPGSSDFRGPESEIGPAADIYAAAMIFAELASGKPGKQALAALAQPLLREAIGLATDADPQKRPPDVESLRVLLQEALQQAKSDEPRAEEDQDLSRQPTELLAQREASTVPTPWPASGLTPVPRPRGGTPPPASAGAERAASPPPRTPSPPGPLAQGQPSGQRPLPGQGPVRAPSPAQPGMPGQTLG